MIDRSREKRQTFANRLGMFMQSKIESSAVDETVRGGFLAPTVAEGLQHLAARKKGAFEGIKETRDADSESSDSSASYAYDGRTVV